MQFECSLLYLLKDSRHSFTQQHTLVLLMPTAQQVPSKYHITISGIRYKLIFTVKLKNKVFLFCLYVIVTRMTYEWASDSSGCLGLRKELTCLGLARS